MQPAQTPADAVRPLLRVRQVREFAAEPVEQEALDAIADAARWSGSSQNSQPWRFIVIRDPEILRAIHDAGAPSTRSLATAAAAIAIVMPERQGRGVALSYDEGRAAERILIAAELLGLGAGIAWLPTEARPLVAERLGVPGGHFVRTVVALGHPLAGGAGPKAPRSTARLPRSETVFEDRWPG
jgi:nitroreductase